jgi:predicted MFS family arabinose efflux permease
VGAIIGNLSVASSRWKKGYFYFCGIFLWIAALTLFALTTWFWLSAAALVVYGIGQTFVGTTTITMLQTRVPQEMRGRMMSLITLLNMGVRPLGDFPAGALISSIGAPATVLISVSVFGAYALFLLTKLKTISEG